MSSDVAWGGAITGLSHGSYGRFISELMVGVVLELHRDPDNEFDENATGVWFKGYQIGWIPKGQNGPLAARIDRGEKFFAVITNHATSGNFATRLYVNVYQTIYATTSESKETTMLNQIIEINKSAVESAGYLEAGRMANDQVGKIAAKKLPMMVRGYADSPIGRLVIANLASMAALQFKPTNKKLARITSAMVVESYTKVIQEFDLDGMLEDLLKSAPMAKAMRALDKVEDSAAS